ncbi:hypothetical protein RHGRI_000594 [Rhododendron griersonianum]|nr:hypothetical protein RHGRI_000594 [Rhododendron griersonianum]
MLQEGEEPAWNLLFKRRLRVWQEEQKQRLLQKLQGYQMDRSRDDIMEWRWNANKIFSLSSAYAEWENQMQNQNGWLSVIWRNLCPPKIEVFVRQAVQNRIATGSILCSRGIFASGNDL